MQLYCKGRGHWKTVCPVKFTAQGALGKRHVKAVAVSSPLRNFVPGISLSQQMEHEVSLGEFAFSTFVSKGHVSLVGSDVQVPLNILRDTRALDFVLWAGIDKVNMGVLTALPILEVHAILGNGLAGSSVGDGQILPVVTFSLF